MRRFSAIVRTTAFETQSEPLALLLAFGAVATTTLASVLHFHQFGEPSRMARDAGLSSILVFGLLHAVFMSIRVFRREIETGTIEMALARSVSRTGFFLAKLSGVVLSTMLFWLTATLAAMTTIIGAEVGGMIAARSGDMARIWGFSVALDAATIVVPLVAAAALNRFARVRFTATATRLVAVAAALSFVACTALALPAVPTALRFVTAAVVALFPLPVFAAAAAAFSVRWKDSAAASLCGLVFLASLPVLSNYYLSTSLAGGGIIPPGRIAATAVAAVPFFAAFAALGIHLFNNRDAG